MHFTPIILSIALLAATLPAALGERNVEELEYDNLGFAIKYLQKYGYLEENRRSYGAEDLAKAIEHLQSFAGLPITGFVDEATIELMKKPRCGFPDVINQSNKHRFVPSGQSRPSNNITYYLKGFSKTISADIVAQRMEQALKVWGRPGKLTSTRVYDNTADIISSFEVGDHGDGDPFDGPGVILAHAFFPPNHDLHFDDDETWYDGTQTQSGTHFYTVALHELGHSLGLRHAVCREAVMYPWYGDIRDPDQPWLSYDDVMGMHHLYVSKLPKPIHFCKNTTTPRF